MNAVTRRLTLAGALIAVTTLGACNDTDDAAGTGGAGASASSEATATPTPTQDETSQAPAAAGGADCLVGTWVGDNEFFLKMIRQLGDVQDVKGGVTLTFAEDGTVTTRYDDWTITAVVDGMSSTVQRTGTDEGVFEVKGAKVSVADRKVGSTLTMKAAGGSMTLPATPIDYQSAGLECAGDNAEIVTPDGTLKLNRR